VILTWVVFFVQLVLLSMFKSLVNEFDVVVVCIIGVTSIFLLFRIFRCPRKAQPYILAGYLFRLFVLFFDVYGRHFFLVPHSGIDSEGFLHSALLIATNPDLLGQRVYGGFYSKFLGLVYMLIVPERLLGQFFNVLFGMSIIFIVYRTLKKLNVDFRVQSVVMTMVSLFPHSVIFSSILLRESIITMLVAASTYYMIEWSLTTNFVDALLAVVFLLMGSAFHAGIIGLLVGYTFMFMFYNPKTNLFSFRARTVLAFGLMMLFGIVVYSQFGHVFLAKFESIENMSTIYNVASSRRGGSAYLTSLQINSIGQLLIYTPIKMLYFLIVPLPHHWRGVSDIIAFVLDAVVYLYFLILVLRNRRIVTDTPLGSCVIKFAI